MTLPLCNIILKCTTGSINHKCNISLASILLIIIAKEGSLFPFHICDSPVARITYSHLGKEHMHSMRNWAMNKWHWSDALESSAYLMYCTLQKMYHQQKVSKNSRKQNVKCNPDSVASKVFFPLLLFLSPPPSLEILYWKQIFSGHCALELWLKIGIEDHTRDCTSVCMGVCFRPRPFEDYVRSSASQNLTGHSVLSFFNWYKQHVVVK